MWSNSSKWPHILSSLRHFASWTGRESCHFKTRVGKYSGQDKLPPIKSKKLIPIVSNGNMDILDADENPLFDKNGRKADRDLVQFVPFYKFSNSDGDKLAEQVLEEVPRQVVEYYLHNKIYPGDPVMNI